MEKPQDPVTPQVTFDNYIIPETVQTSVSWSSGMVPLSGTAKAPAAGFRITGMMLAVATICVLTFLLGVLTTLKLAGPQRDVAEVLPPPLPGEAVSLQEVTRQRAPDLISTPAATAPPGIPDLEAAVLKGLQPLRTVGKLTADEMAQKSLEAQNIVSRNKLRMLREGVLAGVYDIRATETNGMRRLVLTTINAEMTQESIGNLLRKAAADGLIEIPASLSTAEGDVDMETLLFNLIQTSLANDGTAEGMEAAREMSRRAFAASNAQTREVRGARVYTVEPGDSLAYISLQFYGRPGAYLRIFDANREQLSSPDLIKIGQRLIIPK